MNQDARQQRPSLIVAALLAWLVPGAGHAYVLGMRSKGMLLFGAIMGLFVAGLVFSEFQAVRLERHPIYFIAYAFLGLPTLVTMFATSSLSVQGAIPNEALGTLYCATAALLNLLTVLDVFGVAERRAAGVSGDDANSGRRAAGEAAGA